MIHRQDKQKWWDNSKFSGYRFQFSADSTVFKGFVTEKILNAFLSGAIPIYWGTDEVLQIFNKDAFIYIEKDFGNFDEEEVVHAGDK